MLLTNHNLFGTTTNKVRTAGVMAAAIGMAAIHHRLRLT